MHEMAGNRDPIKTNIKLLDILDYVGDSVRPIRERSAVYDAKHVVCIGYTRKIDNKVCIKGYVTQSSHPGNMPHEVSLRITNNVSEWALCCSCKAGTARCKHIVACLLHLNRSEEIEYLSCTDTQQAWGILKTEKIGSWGAKKVTELCCSKTPTRILPTDPELRDAIVKESFTRILNENICTMTEKKEISNTLLPALSMSGFNVESPITTCKLLKWENQVQKNLRYGEVCQFAVQKFGFLLGVYNDPSVREVVQ
ncbi:uncharacterized protein LOC131689257 [Topomyia yanbarensis]|uniref:uncharacterized protein LOC131689257 n=1 Tax=Topomyia yanbarensis TaxID=2498891 RepID=UPI00273C0488|nr:uncharacterized protein LOC131689257 [Topomyia yanbarensis]